MVPASALDRPADKELPLQLALAWLFVCVTPLSDQDVAVDVYSAGFVADILDIIAREAFEVGWVWSQLIPGQPGSRDICVVAGRAESTSLLGAEGADTEQRAAETTGTACAAGVRGGRRTPAVVGELCEETCCSLTAARPVCRGDGRDGAH